MAGDAYSRPMEPLARTERTRVSIVRREETHTSEQFPDGEHVRR